MATASNIFLVGPPACGKTALGRHLAERLKLAFCDSDEFIQQRTGLSVADIFEQTGEGRFREHETEAIAELTKKQGVVLATGGGAILSEENQRCLRAHGTVVYLRIGVAAQLERIADDRTRPLLAGRDKRAALEEISRRREEHYRRIANITVDVDNKSVRDIGDELINALPGGKTDA